MHVYMIKILSLVFSFQLHGRSSCVVPRRPVRLRPVARRRDGPLPPVSRRRLCRPLLRLHDPDSTNRPGVGAPPPVRPGLYFARALALRVCPPDVLRAPVPGLH